MTQEKQNNKAVWIALSVVALCVAIVFFLTLSGGDDDIDVAPENPVVVTPPATSEQPVEPLVPPSSTASSGTGAGVTTARNAGLNIGMRASDAETVIENLLKPETSEGNQTFSVRRTPETPGGYTLIATADNMLDDSLKAQEITAIFTRNSDEQLILSDYQSRIKCWRGADKDTWTNQPCP